MKNRLGFLLSFAILTTVSQQALAAATPEEAARLTAVFQTYLTAEPGVVAITPAGDDYNVTLNFAPLAAKAAKDGASISMSPINFVITPKEAGKWTVKQGGPFNLNVNASPQFALDMKADSYSWTGEFDENLKYFSSGEGEIGGMTFNEKIDDPSQGKADVNVTIKSAKMHQTGVQNADGPGVDADVKYEFEGLTETIASAGSATGEQPPMNIVFKAASGNYDTKATALRSKSFFDIMAFFISHPSKEMIVKDQALLKTTLMESLPLFENVVGDATFKTVEVTTPVGLVTMAEMGFSADINGAVKDGSFGESLSFSGLTVPAAIVPPWATTLVPKDMTFDFNVSDFDLATPASLVLAALDLATEKGLPDGLEEKLLPALLPKGAAKITLNPTSVSNDIYEVAAEGEMTAGPSALPSGKAKVTATGLDEIMKVVQAAPPEAGVQSGVAMIVAAKGMAKPGEDDSLVWEIESTGDGKVLINGIDPTKMQ